MIIKSNLSDIQHLAATGQLEKLNFRLNSLKEFMWFTEDIRDEN